MTVLAHTIHIDPISKPRMTHADKRLPKRPCVARYHAFQDELQLKMNGFVLPDAHWHIVFHMPMPASWSRKKRAEHDGKPHQQKPDKDNLEKAFLDSLFKDDSHIWDGRVTKRWAEEGRIEIWV